MNPLSTRPFLFFFLFFWMLQMHRTICSTKEQLDQFPSTRDYYFSLGEAGQRQRQVRAHGRLFRLLVD
jgi:hypothetical protein